MNAKSLILVLLPAAPALFKTSKTIFTRVYSPMIDVLDELP